ncbi:MAG: TonB-dependent receptor, partial [Bacteroidia bacterium]|nr:TonB-dependent receptor [Bacteroidia bacterium]
VVRRIPERQSTVEQSVASQPEQPFQLCVYACKLRQTYFDFSFDNATLRNKALNGALGFTYNPSDKWRVYMNASTGFRSPNVDDIGKVFDSEPGNVVVPNPDLKPEQAYSVEVGVGGTVATNFYFDVSAFYTTIDNAIARGPSTFNGQDSIDYDGQLSRVLSLQNISKLHVYGLQMGINWQLNKYLKLTSSLNWQSGKEKDPETNRNYAPTHVAPLFGATHFIVRKGKLQVDCYANYNGEISYKNLALSERADSHLYLADADGNPHAPSWWTLNLKASYQVVPHLGLDAGIENIADKRYRPYSSGIVSPGRNFIATLRFKW